MPSFDLPSGGVQLCSVPNVTWLSIAGLLATIVLCPASFIRTNVCEYSPNYTDERNCCQEYFTKLPVPHLPDVMPSFDIPSGGVQLCCIH